ncbi:MAG: RNA methyltransferase [Bacteroidales bacterium]|nr:RNA methyltransferase [Bacteroidales bacterium]
MLSHSQLKFLRSLQINKFRSKEKQILVEGEKLVKECLRKSYLPGYQLLEIFALDVWINNNSELISNSGCLVTSITPKQLEQISIQKSPNQSVALLRHPETPPIPSLEQNELYLATDHIQDPGNMGSLFRIAEWFGVKSILLSNNSVDPYNPKVIQSSMGSIFRTTFHRGDLLSMLQSTNTTPTIYGMMLDGENIYTSNISPSGIIVIGNESKGISKEISKIVTKPLYIPRFSASSEHPESLNAATAAGIVLSEFRRQKLC